MEKQHATLTLDNVQARDTLGGMMMTGWMQVTEPLSHDTAHVFKILHEGLCEPWLAPRHQWMLAEKDDTIWAHFDNVPAAGLWEEHDEAAAIANKGITALERIIDIIYATNQSASWVLLAEGADRIRNARLPIIIDEGKE